MRTTSSSRPALARLTVAGAAAWLVASSLAGCVGDAPTCGSISDAGVGVTSSSELPMRDASGCGGAPYPTATIGIQTDRGPVEALISTAASASEIRWTSGIFSIGGEPTGGAWMLVALTISDEEAAAYRQLTDGDIPGPYRPRGSEEFSELLPGGDWLSSDALDDAFDVGVRRTSVRVHETQPLLVIETVGDTGTDERDEQDEQAER